MSIDRERLARHLVEVQGMEWGQLDGGDHGYWSSLAAHLIADIAAQGFAIVPREATEEMIKAGQATECEHGDMNCGCAISWSAMIAASEEPIK